MSLNRIAVWVICVTAVMATNGTAAYGAGPAFHGLSPSDSSSYADATSGDGTVVVGYYRKDGWQHVYRWTADEGAVSLSSFTGNTYRYGVSADGASVVGTTPETGNFAEAFRWAFCLARRSGVMR